MWKKKSKNGFADRGKWAENEVQTFLQAWGDGRTHREWNRLIDSRAAQRIIAAAKADFDVYAYDVREGERMFGLIEAKETEHDYRLARAKVPQLPNLRRREMAGGIGIVLVHHSTISVWRLLTADYMHTTGDKGSWNVKDLPQFATPGEALAHYYPQWFA